MTIKQPKQRKTRDVWRLKRFENTQVNNPLLPRQPSTTKLPHPHQPIDLVPRYEHRRIARTVSNKDYYSIINKNPIIGRGAFSPGLANLPNNSLFLSRPRSSGWGHGKGRSFSWFLEWSVVSGVQGPMRREGFAGLDCLRFPFWVPRLYLGWGEREEFKLRKYFFFFFSPSPPLALLLRAVPANKPAQCDMPFPGDSLQARLSSPPPQNYINGRTRSSTLDYRS